MNDDKKLPDTDDALKAIRAAIVNNTIISVKKFPDADRGLVLLFANGTELGFGFSGDEGDIYLDAQRRYDQ